MSQQELLKLVIARLDEAGIEYMLTGSLASSLQGEPRATHDIDLVIAIRTTLRAVARTLKAAFPEPQFYLDEEAIRSAIDAAGMFNMIDTREGNKIDFWLLTADAFDQTRFARRTAEDFEGMRLQVSRPEDTILMKLKWAQMSGGSEKQFVDALRVYEVQHGLLDQPYLDAWAARLGVTALLARLRSEAEPIE
ncbi:MAG: nucleotidyltransferase domain-containing protein [Burkholderiales bacterium]